MAMDAAKKSVDWWCWCRSTLVVVAVAAADWTVNLSLLSPLCVLHWRGTWQLLDYFVFAGRADVSGLISVVSGYFICCLCYWTQETLGSFITDVGRWKAWRVVASRTYTVLFAFGLVNLWRGVWVLVDHFFGRGWESGAGSTLVGVALLAALRALRNVCAPPLGMATDHLDGAYTYSPTRFRTKEEGVKCSSVRFLDIVFSVVVVGSLVVFVWRGLWTLLDTFLFPESKASSSWSSLAIGYGVVLLAFCAQPMAVGLSRRSSTLWRRILLEDVFISFACVGAINVWRGVWGIADVYILPDDPVLSNALTNVIGMLGSIVLFAGNNILARGVYLDGEMTDGSGCRIWEPYLRRIAKGATTTKPSMSINDAAAPRLESVVVEATTDCKSNGGVAPCKVQHFGSLGDGIGNDVALVKRGEDHGKDDEIVERETVL